MKQVLPTNRFSIRILSLALVIGDHRPEWSNKSEMRSNPKIDLVGNIALWALALKQLVNADALKKGIKE